MKYFLTKNKTIGNAKLPNGSIGPFEKDTLIKKTWLKVIEKNIPYFLATGRVVEEKDSNVSDAEIIEEPIVVKTKLGNDDDGLTLDNINLDDEEIIEESSWVDLLNEEEKDTFDFYKEKTVKEQKKVLKEKKITFKASDKEDDLIRLIMGK